MPCFRELGSLSRIHPVLLGHGDVHYLLHSRGIATKWKEEVGIIPYSPYSLISEFPVHESDPCT